MTVSSINFWKTGSWGSSNSSSFSSTFNFALYTRTGSSLSLLNSVSSSWGTGANNASLSSLYHGNRFLSLATSAASADWTLSQTAYWGGIFRRSSGAQVLESFYGAMFLESGVRSGTMGVGTTTGATSWGGMPFHGLYSASTSAFPVSIVHSQLVKTQLRAYFIPHVVFNNILATY